MASAAATGPLQPAARPHSMWDVLADALGGATARFDQLTGARINARDINSRAIPLGLGAMRLTQNVKHMDSGALSDERLYKQYQNLSEEPYPKDEKGIHGALDRALWQFSNVYSKVRSGMLAATVLKQFIKHPWLEAANRVGTVFRGVLGPVAAAADAVDTVKDFRRGEWGKGLFHAGKTAFDVISTVTAWRSPLFAGARRAIGAGARWLGGRAVAGWNAARTFVTDTAFPWLRNAWNVTRNFVAEKADTAWNAVRGGVRTGWNAARTFVTDTAAPWLRNAANVARNFVSERAGTAWNAVRGAARTGWNATRTFVTDRVVPWVTERAIPWVTERAIPWVMEEGLPWVARAASRFGPWGLAIAAGAGALWGAYEIYKHPKETQEFLHNVGGFFHNVGAGLTGAPRQKGTAGWHPWADLTASTLRVGWDVLTRNHDALQRDASGAGHAFDEVTGAVVPPGSHAKPRAPFSLSDLFSRKNLSLLAENEWKASIPGQMWEGGVKPAIDAWNSWFDKPQASQPHMPAPPSRPSSHVYVPPAMRSPQPRPQGAGNIPTKTQAEIRVRFDNMPSGARIGPRPTSSGTQVDTGGQFAF